MEEPADDDVYGLEVLEAGWQGPALGRVKPTVDVNGLCVGKYVVLLAPRQDEYTFTVEGQPLWLGRVRLSLLYGLCLHSKDVNYTFDYQSLWLRRLRLP